MLIVTRQFASYQRGDAITDATASAAVLAGEYKNHVVSVATKPAVTNAPAATTVTPAVHTPGSAAAAFERAVDASEAALHAAHTTATPVFAFAPAPHPATVATPAATPAA